MPEGFDIGPDPEAGESLSEMQEEFRREQAALDDQWRRELIGEVDRQDHEEAERLENMTEEAWAAMKPGDPVPVVDFKFKGGDRVVELATGRAGRVMNGERGPEGTANYGVVLDDVGYVVRLERCLKAESDFNSCDALRVIDGVKPIQEGEE